MDWWPEQGGAEQTRAERRALWVCWNACPVRRECLHHAIAFPEEFGIWGGFTSQDRREPIAYLKAHREADTWVYTDEISERSRETIRERYQS